MSITAEIKETMQTGRVKLLKEQITQALSEGVTPDEIIHDGLLAGMGVVGEKFKNGEAFIPEVLISARCMNAGMEQLKPLLVGSGAKSAGKVVIGTVKGDLHDIGKNIVKIMMESKGFEIIDLGVDVPPEKYVDTAIESGARIVCCSALLTTTMPMMRNVVEYAKQKGVRDQLIIMVGGAPITQKYCDDIGADIYTVDAASAADAAFRAVS